MISVFLTSFRITSFAVFEILILGLCGFFIVKRNILPSSGLDIISKLVVEVTLPLFIFTQLILRFDFSLYPNWYIFPILSLLISLCGFIIAYALIRLSKGRIPEKGGFLALVSFQNSGYLVFPLVITLLPKDKADTILIYLFLFLLGFNLAVWSLGVRLLSPNRGKKFELGSLFSPVVIAILFGFLLIILGIDSVLPDVIIRPLKLIGECSIPLAMLVVGGNLALINFTKKVNIFALLNVILAKLILLPAIALVIIYKFKFAYLVGLLIIIETAVPSATSLSVISRHYKTENIDFIGQGIFWTHVLSIFTIPLFLSLFSVISGIQ